MLLLLVLSLRRFFRQCRPGRQLLKDDLVQLLCVPLGDIVIIKCHNTDKPLPEQPVARLVERELVGRLQQMWLEFRGRKYFRPLEQLPIGLHGGQEGQM